MPPIFIFFSQWTAEFYHYWIHQPVSGFREIVLLTKAWWIRGTWSQSSEQTNIFDLNSSDASDKCLPLSLGFPCSTSQILYHSVCDACDGCKLCRPVRRSLQTGLNEQNHRCHSWRCSGRQVRKRIQESFLHGGSDILDLTPHSLVQQHDGESQTATASMQRAIKKVSGHFKHHQFS